MKYNLAVKKMKYCYTHAKWKKLVKCYIAYEPVGIQCYFILHDGQTYRHKVG